MRHVDLWSTYLVGYMSDDIDTYLCSGLTQGGAMAGGQSKNSHNVWNRQEALRLQKQNAAAQKAADRERELEETAAGKAEAEQLNADLAARVTRLESILWNGLERVAAVDLNALLRHDEFPPLELGSDGVAPPRPSWLDYAPPAPGGIAGLFGGRARHDLQLDAARQAFERAERDYDQAEVIRQGRIREKTSRYEAALLAHQNDVARRARWPNSPQAYGTGIGRAFSTTWNWHCPELCCPRMFARGRGGLFAARRAGGRTFRAASG